LRVINNSGVGIEVTDGSSENLFYDVVSSQNRNGIVVGGNLSHTIYDNVFVNISTTNNTTAGFSLWASVPELLSNILVVNLTTANNGTGLTSTENFGQNLFVNVAAANNTTGVKLDNSPANIFSGRLSVGSNNVDCSVSLSSGLGPDCRNQGESDAELTTGIDLSGSFVAKIMLDDSVNASDVDGLGLYGEIEDWTRFAGRYRGWGKDGPLFASVDNRGSCTLGDTCRIWDWSVAANDIGNRGNPALLGVLALPNGDNTLTFVGSDSGTTALRNAVELLFDDNGDDDGLCESRERCVHTPNIGAFQGSDAKMLAHWTNGQITNVTLFRPETNP
jgi:hypothetical protein